MIKYSQSSEAFLIFLLICVFGPVVCGFPYFVIKFSWWAVSHSCTGEISGSHSGKYVGGCLLGCCIMWSSRNIVMFLRCLLPSSSGNEQSISTRLQPNIPADAIFILSVLDRYSFRIQSYECLFFAVLDTFHHLCCADNTCSIAIQNMHQHHLSSFESFHQFINFSPAPCCYHTELSFRKFHYYFGASVEERKL